MDQTLPPFHTSIVLISLCQYYLLTAHNYVYAESIDRMNALNAGVIAENATQFLVHILIDFLSTLPHCCDWELFWFIIPIRWNK